MEPAPVTAAPEEVIEPPTVEADDTPDWMTDDLVELNRRVTAAGLIGDVYFDFDKYDLKAEARDRLAKNAAFMRENPSFRFTIEGHCDERGTNEYNMALGEQRALAARRYLIGLGVAADRLSTISYGETRPWQDNSREITRRLNRRGEFRFRFTR